MSIDKVPECGWFEVDAAWLAGIFGLQSLGPIRIEGPKILIGVAGVAPGTIVAGNLMHAIIPTGYGPKQHVDELKRQSPPWGKQDS